MFLENVDFTITPFMGTIVVGSVNDETVCAMLDILDDNTYEKDQNFTMTVSSTEDNVVIDEPSATVTILNINGKCMYIPHVFKRNCMQTLIAML